MIKQRIVLSAMGIALTAASSMAAAAESATGWYFGISAGQAQADLDRATFDDLVTGIFLDSGISVISGSSSLDDKDTSWSAVAGYSFSPHFAIEGGYIDLGTAKYRASGTVIAPGPAIPTQVSFAADFEVTGFTAAAIGSLPIGEVFEARAHAGVLFANLDSSASASVAGFGSTSDSTSTDSRDLFFGVGAGMHLGEQWSFSLDWQRFKDVGDEEESGENDIDRISLGVIYRL